MKSITENKQASLLRDERGLSTVEYVIILVLIAVAGMGLWKTFGEGVTARITGSTDQLNSEVALPGDSARE